MGKGKFKTFLICLALFLTFLVMRFPYRNLRGLIFGKLYKATHIVVLADDMFPTFFGWPGMGLTKVNVTMPLGGSDLNVSAERVILKVGLAGLFPPIPAVSLHLKELRGGGRLFVKVGQGAGRSIANVEARSVDLSQLHLSALSEPVNGILNGDIDITLNDADLTKSNGDIELRAEKMKTPTLIVPMGPDYSFLIPSMNLGPLKADIAMKEGNVNFTTFQFGSNDSDLSGSLSGEIRLAKEFINSSIQLTLRLKLSESYRTNPQAATFVTFLDTYRLSTPGAFGMRCSATIVDITTKYACAIPEKLPE